jgi:nifR3 family TIM-barrel protein
MSILPKDSNGCPFLILAPMEGVGDVCFRKAMASIGGFDEAVRDFLRVPRNAHVPSLAKEYISSEIAPIPLAAQLMGSDPELMADMAREVAKRGAPRIDLNCGCPSNKVTGRGAGSSLLKDPGFLNEVARAIVQAVDIPVTLKMRSGYDDTSLFKENLLAAQESGVKYITLHPRTKADGYGPPANWDLIALAKTILKIPLVGNGDILNVNDALRMLRHTGCDALMIGRGCVVNPFIFHQIRSCFAKSSYHSNWSQMIKFLETYCAHIPEMRPRSKVNKLKQLFGFLFKRNASLIERRQTILVADHQEPDAFLQFATDSLRRHWDAVEHDTASVSQ